MKVKQYQVIKAILHKLKTGCQWRELPMKQFFRSSYKYGAVYLHFQKWSKDGSCEAMWIELLKKHKALLDMSSVQLEGAHTPSKRGGEAVDYQARKNVKQVTCLF